MPKSKYSYDPKSQELAEHFCQDLLGHSSYKDVVERLAQHIQDAVEDFEFTVPHDSGFQTGDNS